VQVSDPGRVMAASAALEARGFLVRGVRPPTVPEGTSRLRLCLQSGHAPEEVRALSGALAEVLRESPCP